MTQQEWKKTARILKEAYKELEAEAIASNIDIFSDEYKTIVDKARETILSKLGFTLEEYREMKDIIAPAKKTDLDKQIEEVKKLVADIPEPKIPTLDEIEQIARDIAQEYIKPPVVTHNTTNEIVKETTHEVRIEQPKIVETTRVTKEKYDDKHLRKEIEKLYSKIDNLKVPEQLDVDKIKSELFDALSLNIQKDIDVMGMPDFRKLAMGLQDQINTLSSQVSTINTQDDAFELILSWKLGYNSYMEYTEVAGNITQVNYWTDSGKGTKLFTKDITYSGSNPTVVVITDEITGKILTTTIAYSGDDITSVTKTLV